jgi:hypothetical protein
MGRLNQEVKADSTTPKVITGGPQPPVSEPNRPRTLVQDAGLYALGAMAEYSRNMTLNLSDLSATARSNMDSMPAVFQGGRVLGNVAASLQGAAEIVTGVGGILAATGGVVASGGALAVPATAAQAASIVRVAHGSAAAHSALTSIDDNILRAASGRTWEGLPAQGTVSKVDGAPPVDAGKQGKHIKGHPNNTDPGRTRWADGVDSVKETQEAWIQGKPVTRNPDKRIHDAGRPIGENGETRVNVHMDKKGAAHGHPLR